MAIFDFNTDLFAANMMPPLKRIGRYLAWAKVLLKPLQFIRDALFGTYRDGNAAANWSNATNYSVGNQVKYIDKAIYQCWVASTAGILPTNTDYWVKVQDKFVGIVPRSKYNSQTLLLEWVLNEWFGTTFVNSVGSSDIYISSVSNTNQDFIVGVTESQSSSAVYQNGDADSFVQAQNPTFSGQLNFRIFIPVAVWTALASTDDDRDNTVRDIADLYFLAGIQYTIVTY